MKHEVKKLKGSQVQIDFELDEQEFAKFWDKALEHLKSHVKMDGFRPGTVPKEMVEKKVGQENLLMEAGDLAVKETYKKFVVQNDMEPVDEPNVQITKIVPIAKQSRILDGEAVGTKEPALIFTVTVAVLPEIELPDYKKIAATVKNAEVSVDEKEIEDALDYIQKSRAKFSPVDRTAQEKDFVEIKYQNKDINDGKEVTDRFILGEGGFLKDFEDNIKGMKAGDKKEFMAKFPDTTPNKELAGNEGMFLVTMVSVQHMELSPINDEFAKSLGAFDTLVALKENLREGITQEKRAAEKQRARGEMLSKISQEVAFDLPEKMVTYESERLLDDLKAQIAGNFNVSFENYLASVKKTEEEMKQSFRLDAEKRIKNFLVLRQIGKQEHVEVSNAEIETEINQELKKYPPEQADKIDIRQLKEYSKGVLFNEKVFQILETLSQNS